MLTQNESLLRLTGPAKRPVTVSEAKRTLRLNQTDTTFDDQVKRHIEAATEQVEADTDRCLINQSFALYLNSFPGGSQLPIEFAQKPIDSVTSIEYLDTDGNKQTYPPEKYELDQARRQVYLLSGNSWPSTLQQQNAITVTFVCGYGTSSEAVPRLIKEAVLMQVGKWFYNPTMDSDKHDEQYDRIITRILRTSYP